MSKKDIQRQNKWHRLPILGILCLLVVYASAQSYWAYEARRDFNLLHIGESYTTNDTIRTKKVSPKPDKQKLRLIKLLYSSYIIRRDSSDIDVLIDSIQFLHEGAYLYCDSAHFDRIANTFEAYSNVRMEQGDTLFLYGDYMRYDGNTQKIKVRENVKLEHRSGTLFTDSLNYDRIKNIGYYFDGGVLVDSLNELTSIKGQYEPSKTLATFTNEVIVTNPNFKLYSDTLFYNTETKVVKIISPTKIESDSGTIHSSRGYYNTLQETAILLDQSSVINKEGNRILKGDSILYDKHDNSGEVFGNMFMQDTAKHVLLLGNYGFYNGVTDYSFATDSAQLVEYSQGDSLYLHGDTLEMIKLPPRETWLVKRDSVLNEGDTVPTVLTDSILEMKNFYEMKAYHNVRFFRSDVQGVCDSLQFNSADSTLTMYREPVLWNQGRQLTGDTIYVFMNDSAVDRMRVQGSAFSIEQKDSLHFNQLKSRMIDFHLLDNQLKRVYAEGNVETITYPEERDGTLNRILNYLVSSYLNIDLEDGQMSRLKAWPAPVGKTTPFFLIEPDKLRLQNFYWFDYMRPLDKEDIFRKVDKKDTDQRPKRAAIFDREEE